VETITVAVARELFGRVSQPYQFNHQDHQQRCSQTIMNYFTLGSEGGEGVYAQFRGIFPIAPATGVPHRRDSDLLGHVAHMRTHNGLIMQQCAVRWRSSHRRPLALVWPASSIDHWRALHTSGL
jgi:hypothetical protein